MAFRRRRGAKKVRRTVKRRGVRKFTRKAKGGGMTRDNHAVCSETSHVAQLPANTVIPISWALSSADYIRAQTIAENYQEFKIDYIEVTVKPYFDTFSNNAGAVGTAPQLYVQYISTGNVPGGITEMRHNGCNPRSLAKDGNIKYRIKPSIIISGSAGGYTMIKKTPWLNTQDLPTTGAWHPNATRHYGMALYCENSVAGNWGTIETEVHFRFRKPQYPQIGVTDPVVHFDDLPVFSH